MADLPASLCQLLSAQRDGDEARGRRCWSPFSRGCVFWPGCKSMRSFKANSIRPISPSRHCWKRIAICRSFVGRPSRNCWLGCGKFWPMCWPMRFAAIAARSSATLRRGVARTVAGAIVASTGIDSRRRGPIPQPASGRARTGSSAGRSARAAAGGISRGDRAAQFGGIAARGNRPAHGPQRRRGADALAAGAGTAATGNRSPVRPRRLNSAKTKLTLARSRLRADGDRHRRCARDQPFRRCRAH